MFFRLLFLKTFDKCEKQNEEKSKNHRQQYEFREEYFSFEMTQKQNDGNNNNKVK